MSVAAMELYDDALATGAGLHLCGGEGRRRLDLARWRSPADPVDQELVDRCSGPTLDVGCGPGRMLVALTSRGVPALGVDVAPAAVALARRSGAAALRRSVFARLPGEGRWQEILLVDGNVGIGGDPATLLARTTALLSDSGRLYAEVEPGDVDEIVDLRVEDERGRISEPFAWARLGAAALVRRAAPVGLRPVDAWAAGGRHFLALALDRIDPATPRPVDATTSKADPAASATRPVRHPSAASTERRGEAPCRQRSPQGS